MSLTHGLNGFRYSRRRPRVLTAADFAVQTSTKPGVGLGLFALTRLRKGDIIGEYTGRRLTDEEANREPHVSSLYLVWVCKDCYIDGSGPEGNYTRYINHCTQPNAELVTSSRWKMARIKALRRIEPGEEIFFNYGPEYWEILGLTAR